MNNTTTLGWDLGGAHLKAVLVDANGKALQVFQQPCPLWRGLEHLRNAAASVMDQLEGYDVRHAVTMTGELVDMFPSRLHGVVQVTQCMTDLFGPDDMVVYGGRSRFVAAAASHDHADDIGSANWHASATYVGTQVDQAVFVDIGSTTTDIIPLHQGSPAALGYSDAERLHHEELVYTGVVRTPVMAVAQWLPFAGGWQRVAAEHFATTGDVYRLTGELASAYDMAETADGKGKSFEDNARRLARMVGRDLDDAMPRQWRQLALAVRSQQLHQLQSALERLLSRDQMEAHAPLVGAGAGAFLACQLAGRLGREYLPVSELVKGMTPEIAAGVTVCFPAYAVACLAAREFA